VFINVFLKTDDDLIGCIGWDGYDKQASKQLYAELVGNEIGFAFPLVPLTVQAGAERNRCITDLDGEHVDAVVESAIEHVASELQWLIAINDIDT
jgi:hypothetical protein